MKGGLECAATSNASNSCRKTSRKRNRGINIRSQQFETLLAVPNVVRLYRAKLYLPTLSRTLQHEKLMAQGKKFSVSLGTRAQWTAPKRKQKAQDRQHGRDRVTWRQSKRQSFQSERYSDMDRIIILAKHSLSWRLNVCIVAAGKWTSTSSKLELGLPEINHFVLTPYLEEAKNDVSKRTVRFHVDNRLRKLQLTLCRDLVCRWELSIDRIVW